MTSPGDCVCLCCFSPFLEMMTNSNSEISDFHFFTFSPLLLPFHGFVFPSKTYTNDLLTVFYDGVQMKGRSEWKRDETAHLNLSLDDCSVVKIHTNEQLVMVMVMMHSYLNRPPSAPLPAHEGSNHCKLHIILWFLGVWRGGKHGSLHFVSRTLPAFCIEPLDFLFTETRWLLICRCSSLPQHMDLVMVWQFVAGRGVGSSGRHPSGWTLTWMKTIP